MDLVQDDIGLENDNGVKGRRAISILAVNGVSVNYCNFVNLAEILHESVQNLFDLRGLFKAHGLDVNLLGTHQDALDIHRFSI